MILTASILKEGLVSHIYREILKFETDGLQGTKSTEQLDAYIETLKLGLFSKFYLQKIFIKESDKDI